MSYRVPVLMFGVPHVCLQAFAFAFLRVLNFATLFSQLLILHMSTKNFEKFHRKFLDLELCKVGPVDFGRNVVICIDLHDKYKGESFENQWKCMQNQHISTKTNWSNFAQLQIEKISMIFSQNFGNHV